MYKHILLLILSGLFLAACDSKSEAPAVVEEATEAAEQAAEAVAEATEEAAEAVEEAAGELTAGEVGVAECDDYIAKTKACLDTLPEAARSSSQAGLDMMVEQWKEAAKTNKDALASACKTAIDTNRAGMEAMGCDW